jgi:nucleotide-binding universal stress UspA family protein
MKSIFEEGEPPVKPSRTASRTSTPPDAKRVLQIKTILVPLDFSRTSIQALKYTIPLAEEFGATIHLVHVQPADDFTALENAGGLMLNCADSIALMQDRLSEALPKKRPFWPDNCHVVSGRPFEEICKLAGRLEASLIVLPTRGLSRLKHAFLGSTAERVVRYAPCPVLIPRGAQFKLINWDGSGDGRRLHLRRILAPVDFSDCSMAGVRYAALLARRTGAILRLVHVVFPHTEILTLDRVTGDLSTVAHTAKVTARLRMKELLGHSFLQGVKAETIIRTGQETDKICAEAARDNVVLVVISTHGRTGFKRAVIGSVAEQVVRYAECPVLTVPSRGCIS